MSKKKKTVRISTNTVVDHNTGEVLRTEILQTGSKETEPAFVKLYIDDIRRLNDLPQYANKLMYALARSMGYSNIVSMYKPIKVLICQETGIAMESLNRAVKLLKKTGILIPVGEGRGLYRMDPNLFGRGKWEDIKKLRLSIDYTLEGKRKMVAITHNQLELFESKKEELAEEKVFPLRKKGGSEGGEAPRS